MDVATDCRTDSEILALFTVPFALIAEELHDFFRVRGDLHTAAARAPHVGEGGRIHLAAQWGAYSVRWDEERSLSKRPGYKSNKCREYKDEACIM